MAQLKIKQISDFVTGVGTIHDATVGTAAGTAISTAESDAIATASADATSKANAAEAGAVATASADATSKADTAESNAVSTASADATSKANAAEAGAVATASADATSKADTAESNAVATANGYTDGRETIINKAFSDADVVVLNAAKSYSDVQKGRLDVLLSDSDGALDTFVEIENFIKNLSSADINGLIQDIADAESDAIVSANSYTDGRETIINKAFADADVVLKGQMETYADTAESDAVVSANGYTDGRETIINKAFSDADVVLKGQLEGYADTAESDAVVSANGYTDGREVIINKAFADADAVLKGQLEGYADTAESDAVVSANGYTDDEITKLDADLQGQIDGLAGVSFEEVIADFQDAKTAVSGVSFDLNNVKVFVNGLQIHESVDGEGWTSANGRIFAFNLPYALEATDHVVISGKIDILA